MLDLGSLAWNLWYDFRGKQVNRMILYMHISPFLLKRKKKVGETSNPSMNICLYKQRKTEDTHQKILLPLRKWDLEGWKEITSLFMSDYSNCYGKRNKWKNLKGSAESRDLNLKSFRRRSLVLNFRTDFQQQSVKSAPADFEFAYCLNGRYVLDNLLRYRTDAPIV